MNDLANGNNEFDTTGIYIFNSLMTVGEVGLALALQRVPVPKSLGTYGKIASAGVGAMGASGVASVESMNGGAGEAWGSAIGGFGLGTLGALAGTTLVGAFLVSPPGWLSVGVSVAASLALGNIGNLIGGPIGGLIVEQFGSNTPNTEHRPPPI